MNPIPAERSDLIHQNLHELNDQQEIIETVVRVSRSADRGDWESCRSCFTNEIFLDHETGNHGPSNRKTDEVIEEWKNLFKAYSSSLHFVSSFEIDIEEGEAECNSLVQSIQIEASNSQAGRVLQSFGSYCDTLILDGPEWKISKRIYRQVAKVTL